MKWAWLLLAACSRSPTVTSTTSTSTTPSTSASTSMSTVVDASVAVEAAALPVHPERAFALPPAPECHDDLRCRIEHAYSSDEKSKALALELFDVSGDVAGTDHDFTMDGGFR